MSVPGVTVNVPFLSGQDYLEYELTASTFERLCGELLDRAVEPIRGALRKARLKQGDIDLALLAGGSSQLPGIYQRVEQIVGIRPCVPPRDLMYSVAYGAALYHRRIFELPHGEAERRILGDGLGVLTHDGGEIRVKLLLTHDQELPAEEKHDLSLDEGHSEVRIELRRGENSDAHGTKPIRSRTLRLRDGARRTGKLRVIIKVDENRTISLTAFDPGDPTNAVGFEVDSATLREEELDAERQRLHLEVKTLDVPVAFNQARHPCIGIDLGTTTCELAHVGRAGNATPEYLENLDAPVAFLRGSYPSVVYFPAGQAGPEVANKKALDALNDQAAVGRVFDSFKTRMGQTRAVTVDGISMTPRDLSAHLLAKIWRDARVSYLGAASDLRSAVVTVPAAFGPDECADTIDAARLAGISEVHLIDEPTAAYLHYQHVYPDITNGDIHYALVFDYGGGTADVSVLDVSHDPGIAPGKHINRLFRMVATDGDSACGGRLIDEAIADHLREQFEQSHGYSLKDKKYALGRLRQAAEKAKVDLSILLEGGFAIA